MLISIIIPTFNRRELVHRAITSCFECEHASLDVVVVDDGSNDGTWDELQRHQRLGSGLRVHRHDNAANRGVSASRNLGLQVAVGDFITFLDSDDELLPGRFTQALAMFDAYRDVEAAWDPIAVDCGNGVASPISYMTLQGAPFFGCYCGEALVRVPPTPALLVRRSAFARCGRFDERKRIGEDYEMWLRVLYSLKCAYSSSEQPLVVVHKHEGNTVIENPVSIELTAIRDVLRWAKSRTGTQTTKALRERYRDTLFYYMHAEPQLRSGRFGSLINILVRAGFEVPSLLSERRYWANLVRKLLNH